MGKSNEAPRAPGPTSETRCVEFFLAWGCGRETDRSHCAWCPGRPVYHPNIRRRVRVMTPALARRAMPRQTTLEDCAELIDVCGPRRRFSGFPHTPRGN